MRRLIFIFLILWLPLQAWSGVVAAGCVGRGSEQHVAPSVGMLKSFQDHAGIAAPVVDSESAQAGGVHALGDAHSVNNAVCADGVDCCVTANILFCVAAVTAEAADSPPVGPTRKGDEAFFSVSAIQAFKPPIAAA